MLRSRTLFVIAISLLLLGISIFTFTTRKQEPAQIFPATVNRDCAPWDGSAFSLSIRISDDTIIYISIWQSPDILFPKSFSFPDDTGQVGNATYQSVNGEYETLSGSVWFESVSEEKPIAGRFSLKSERGGQFEGQFIAAWTHHIVLCG